MWHGRSHSAALTAQANFFIVVPAKGMPGRNRLAAQRAQPHLCPTLARQYIVAHSPPSERRCQRARLTDFVVARITAPFAVGGIYFA